MFAPCISRCVDSLLSLSCSVLKVSIHQMLHYNCNCTVSDHLLGAGDETTYLALGSLGHYDMTPWGLNLLYECTCSIFEYVRKVPDDHVPAMHLILSVLYVLRPYRG